MFELTHKHLELITADVNKADISFSHLKYDLIDHICCDLENEMGQGVPFEKAYEMVRKKIGLRGLQQIQEDTLSLIDKKYRIMKNTMKIFGVVSTILMAVGALFKIEHWPTAGILITIGFFLLCFVFLPSAVYVSYREVSNRTKLFMHLTGFLAGFLFAISFLFKIQHWPGAGYLMVLAAIVALCFILAFFINQWRQSSSKAHKTAFMLGLLGSASYLLGFLFKMHHWPGAYILYMLGAALLLYLAFPVLIVVHYKEYSNVSSRFIFLTFAVIWFIVPTALITLDVSKDVRQGFIDKEYENQFNIQHLTKKNERLFGMIEGLKFLGSNDIKAFVVKEKSESDELVNYIQELKVKIINMSGSESISQNQQINFEKLRDADGDAAKKVLIVDGEANKIKEKLEQFRKFLAQDSIVGSGSIEQVKVLLATNSPDKEMPEYYGTWERNNLLAFTLITAMNKLSAIQEKVRTAEFIVLKDIYVKPGSELVVANAGK